MRKMPLTTGMVCIGRIYASGNLNGEEGIAVCIGSDSRVSYRLGGPHGKWIEYDPQTKKETEIRIPLL